MSSPPRAPCRAPSRSTWQLRSRGSRDVPQHLALEEPQPVGGTLDTSPARLDEGNGSTSTTATSKRRAAQIFDAPTKRVVDERRQRQHERGGREDPVGIRLTSRPCRSARPRSRASSPRGGSAASGPCRAGASAGLLRIRRDRRGRGARGTASRAKRRLGRRRRARCDHPLRTSTKLSTKRTTSVLRSGWRSLTTSPCRRADARQLIERTRSPGRSPGCPRTRRRRPSRAQPDCPRTPGSRSVPGARGA